MWKIKYHLALKDILIVDHHFLGILTSQWTHDGKTINAMSPKKKNQKKNCGAFETYILHRWKFSGLFLNSRF